MGPERFGALADAYGAAVARWPQAEREAASLFMAVNPDIARDVLAAAERLDQQLDEWKPLALERDQLERAIAAAPRQRQAHRLLRWFVGAGIGAGLATACAAGLLVGSTMGTDLGQDHLQAVSVAMDDEDGLTDTFLDEGST